MDLVINNTGDRKSRRGKDNHRDFEPENEERRLGKLGEEASDKNFRAD